MAAIAARFLPGNASIESLDIDREDPVPKVSLTSFRGEEIVY